MQSFVAPALTTLGLVVLGGYLLGSIPFGVIATKLGGLGSLRDIGSGSIGATNVLRTGRKDLAAITLIGDGGKGLAAVLIARALFASGGHDAAVTMGCLAGAGAFIGHLFPVWLKFRGGKGVATAAGVMFATAWPVGVLAGAAWLIVARLSRYSSLAALTAAALAPVFMFTTDQAPVAKLYLAVFMAVLIFVRHRQNIGRLMNGTESRIGEGAKTA